jgi:hypothetical protein
MGSSNPVALRGISQLSPAESLEIRKRIPTAGFDRSNDLVSRHRPHRLEHLLPVEIQHNDPGRGSHGWRIAETESVMAPLHDALAPPKYRGELSFALLKPCFPRPTKVSEEPLGSRRESLSFEPRLSHDADPNDGATVAPEQRACRCRELRLDLAQQRREALDRNRIV